MIRPWNVGLLSVIVLLIAAGCGGEATPTPTATPIPTATPTATPTPTQGPIGTATPADTALDPGAKYRWEVSTVDEDGAKPSLAVHADGTPHIAYMLEALPGFLNYAVLDTGNWAITEVAAGYFYGPLEIQLDQEGVAHIAWHNHDTEDGAYAVLRDGEWVVHNVNHPGHDGWDNSLAIDSAGRPHTATIDPSQFGGQSGIEYATFDGDDWEVEEVGSGPIPYEFGTGIVLDSQDRPYVVWYDDSLQALRYASKSDDDQWTISEVDSGGDVGRFPSMVLDEQGNPAVSYYEFESPTSGHIKFAAWDGAQWNSQRVDKLDNVVLGHLGARKNSSLVLDPSGVPLIAYSDEEIIKLARWEGSKWSIETVFTSGDGSLGQQVSLGVDGSGALHLTFVDKTQLTAHGVRGAVMYARGTP